MAILVMTDLCLTITLVVTNLAQVSYGTPTRVAYICAPVHAVTTYSMRAKPEGCIWLHRSVCNSQPL